MSTSIQSLVRAASVKPIIIEHDGIFVVRDDLFPGGTKARIIHRLFGEAREYVYASPVQGYAQVALAHAARRCGKVATVFCAARRDEHPRTLMARKAGAQIHAVRPGYLSVVRCRAAGYTVTHGAVLLPFGLDCEAMIMGIAELALGLGVVPTEVWSVAGSGTLTRGFQRAWPQARFFAVRIGCAPNAGRAAVLDAPERYEQSAKKPPPFPSCDNYDAKAWRFIREMASPGALFWNVAG